MFDCIINNFVVHDICNPSYHNLLWLTLSITCLKYIIEENILSINLVNTNGRFFYPNIHVVGEKSPIIVDIVAICWFIFNIVHYGS